MLKIMNFRFVCLKPKIRMGMLSRMTVRYFGKCQRYSKNTAMPVMPVERNRLGV